MDISVIIPTYNRQNLLKRALVSVQNQTYKPKEIIVVNDGSNDFTCKVLEDFDGVKYFYKQNGGVSSARNFGIKKSSCKWVAFLDDDDEWMGEKLALHVKLHEQNPSLHASYTDERWVRDGEFVNIPKKYKKDDKNIFEKSLNYCNIAPSSALIDKDVFEKIGYFDESLEVCEDYDMWLRILLDFHITLIDKPLIIKHSSDVKQLSFKHWGMDRFRVKSLQKIYPAIKDKAKKELTKKVLLHKLNLLIKGARKHNRFKMVKKYEALAKSFG